jgi:hypothetical protein
MFRNTQPCDIGYCLADPSGGFAFQPPRTVFSERDRPLAMRAVQNCPAVNALERQLVEMPSPIGIRMTLANQGGQLSLNVNPQGTFAQPEQVQKIVSMEPPDRWRHPKKPVIQIRLPIFFVTDEACLMTQLPPFLSPHMRRWPGTMIAGRFPVALWPQNLTWSFEWDRADEELAIRRGEPLCYFMFEFNDPDKRPRLVEAALTDELDEYRRGMQGLHHLTSEVEEIMEMAKSRRPERLLVPLAEAEA